MSGAVPALRFPGFEGDWNGLPLERLCTLKSGKFIPAAKINPSHEDGLYPCYGGNGIRGYVSDYNTVGTFPLIGRQGALCGNVQLASGQFYSTEHALIATPKANIDVNWLYWQLLRMNLNQYSTGLAQPGLSVDVLNAVVTTKPASEAEQTKIAEFLGVVDAKLTALRRKKSGLETFKSGLMQQLFTQTLRFTRDDGTDFPDWEEMSIDQLAEVNPKTGALPVEFRYVDLESVTAGILGDTQIISSSEAPSRAQRNLKPNDILFQMVRPYQRNNLFFREKGIFVASTGYAQLRARQVPEFLYQAIHTDTFVNDVLERCTGTGYPAINSNDLAGITLPVPHPDEQRKIADALSALDAKINGVAGQIAHMQTFKQGLLQQMFV